MRPNSTTLTLLALVILAAGLGLFTTAYMGCAALAYFLMVWGICARKGQRVLHRRLMFSAMGIDLSLVLLLELQRDAIGTVISLEMNTLPLLHVLFSALAVVCYVPMILMGRKLWAAENVKLRTWHRRIGWTTFLLRSLGFLLMFSLLEKAP